MALLYSAIICMRTEGGDGMGDLVVAEKTALGHCPSTSSDTQVCEE
jgi:hypothetical protein